MTFDLEAAREICNKLCFPWEYDEYDNAIVCQNIETEIGEYGVELARWKEQISQYVEENRAKEIIEGANALPAALDEIERLKISAYGWEADACKFARNSDYWRNRCTSADQTIEQNTAHITKLKSDIVAKSVTINAMCKQLELSATHIVELEAKCASQKKEIREMQENRTAEIQRAIDKVVTTERHRYADLQQIRDDQATRIAELEAAYALFIEANNKCADLEADTTDKIVAALRTYESLEAIIAKQRAALKKLGKMYHDKSSRAKFLDGRCDDLLDQNSKLKRSLNESTFTELATERNQLLKKHYDQLMALQVLGKRSGKRGKALVEERKVKMQLDASRFGMGIPEETAIARAKEQLREEGLL